MLLMKIIETQALSMAKQRLPEYAIDGPGHNGKGRGKRIGIRIRNPNTGETKSDKRSGIKPA